MATTAMKIKARVCAMCPFCILARWKPESAFARTLRRLEKDCPFCRAYAALKQEQTDVREEPRPASPGDDASSDAPPQ